MMIDIRDAFKQCYILSSDDIDFLHIKLTKCTIIFIM